MPVLSPKTPLIATGPPPMNILTSFPFVLFIVLVVLNFVLIFATPLAQAAAGLFAASLILAAITTILTAPGGRVIGGIVLVLGAVMAMLLAQQAGYSL